MNYKKLDNMAEGANAFQISAISMMKRAGVEKGIIDEIRLMDPSEIATDYFDDGEE